MIVITVTVDITIMVTITLMKTSYNSKCYDKYNGNYNDY